MVPAQSRWSLQGQVALVVGGSRGIGRAVAALVGLGARVAIVSRSQESVSAACAEISAKGGEAIVSPPMSVASRMSFDSCRRPRRIGDASTFS